MWNKDIKQNTNLYQNLFEKTMLLRTNAHIFIQHIMTNVQLWFCVLNLLVFCQGGEQGEYARELAYITTNIKNVPRMVRMVSMFSYQNLVFLTPSFASFNFFFPWKPAKKHAGNVLPYLSLCAVKIVAGQALPNDRMLQESFLWFVHAYSGAYIQSQGACAFQWELPAKLCQMTEHSRNILCFPALVHAYSGVCIQS